VAALCVLLLGIAIGYYLCLKCSVTQRVVSMSFNPQGKLVVAAKGGDLLKWKGVPGKIKFFPLNPCTNPNDVTGGTCTMKDSGIYPFSCESSGSNTCPDPVVGGGDDMAVSAEAAATSHLDPPYANPGPSTVYIYCNNGTAAATYPISGHVGEGFTLQLAGPGADFSATLPAGTCTGGNTLNSASPNCRIAPAAVSAPSYPITVQSCANPGTTALTVLP